MSMDIRTRVLKEVGKVVVGREEETELLLVSLLARGHTLIEGVPGVSKTMLAKAFSKCLGLAFKRVQFTPDMLPLDIVGGFIFNMKSREFEFRRGPVFTDILLADEINRAPPKVQSALVEAMQELQVTIEGDTEKLPSPFMVIATENPLEFQGVYPLPEGQLDRFMVKLKLDYPSASVESAIIRRNLSEMDLEVVKQVVSSDELAAMFKGVDDVRVSDEILEYLAKIARETRTDQRIDLGASPRAMIHLVHAARSVAYLSGREDVIPDDIKRLSIYVLTHRIKLDQSSALRDQRPDAECDEGEEEEEVDGLALAPGRHSEDARRCRRQFQGCQPDSGRGHGNSALRGEVPRARREVRAQRSARYLRRVRGGGVRRFHDRRPPASPSRTRPECGNTGGHDGGETRREKGRCAGTLCHRRIPPLRGDEGDTVEAGCRQDAG